VYNMLNGFNIICEALQQSHDVPYVIHKHIPRSGSEHYDLRFGNPRNDKELFSFAAPKNFLETINQKTLLVRTKEHLSRWMDLKSYRLTDIEKGIVTVKIATSKFFDLTFNGKIINGSYKLFKMSNTYRQDRWLLIKNKE
jgi:hypothetical protein